MAISWRSAFGQAHPLKFIFTTNPAGECGSWIFFSPSSSSSSFFFFYMYLFTRVRTPATAKSLQSCAILCDPIDGSPPGSTVPGVLQARTLEWVAISFSNAWKWKVKVKSLSRVRLSATPWTAAFLAPPSMEFSRQEYWSGVPLPSPYRDTKWKKKVS